MALTIRRVLQCSVVDRARPHILGSSGHLDDVVHGIHVAESADLAGLLEGGELILSSGLSLTESVEQTRGFLEQLAQEGAVGVIFSFLSDSTEIKNSLRAAAAMVDVPVILLDDRARFIEVIEAVHDLTRSSGPSVNGADVVSNFLTSASVKHLSPKDLFFTVADLLQVPLVLEDALSDIVLHRGLGTEQMRQYLRSNAEQRDATSHGLQVAGERWASFPVVADGQELGLLVAPLGPGAAPVPLALEHAGRVLGIRLVRSGERLTLLRQAALTDVLQGIRDGECATERAAALRAEMLGITGFDRFVAAVVCLPGGAGSTGAEGEDLLARIQKMLCDARYTALAARLDTPGPVAVGIVLCLGDDESVDGMLGHVCGNLGEVLASVSDSWRMGVSEEFASWRHVSCDGLHDAYRVAHSALTLDRGTAGFYRARDLGFRWLVQRLAGEADSRNFVRDQLAPLLAEPELLELLEAFVATNGTIAKLSRAVHLSRPSVYARLRRIEKDLGYDLDDPDVRTSLHLALTLHRLGVPAGSGPATTPM